MSLDVGLKIGGRLAGLAIFATVACDAVKERGVREGKVVVINRKGDD